jgi:hypothetical protein
LLLWLAHHILDFNPVEQLPKTSSISFLLIISTFYKYLILFTLSHLVIYPNCYKLRTFHWWLISTKCPTTSMTTSSTLLPNFPNKTSHKSQYFLSIVSYRFPILCPLSATNKKNANTARSSLSQLCGGYGVRTALLLPPSDCAFSTRPQLQLSISRIQLLQSPLTQGRSFSASLFLLQ